MEALPEAKSTRLLTIYSRLVNGEALSKSELAAAYHVSERSIQRDMDSLRCFLANENIRQEIIFDLVLSFFQKYMKFVSIRGQTIMLKSKILDSPPTIHHLHLAINILNRL